MRLIDADALIAHMEADAEQMEMSVFKMATYAAINDVKHQPTIEERKTGRWIDKSDGLIEGAWNYCSVCGEQAIDLYDYCPNCGARMEDATNG